MKPSKIKIEYFLAKINYDALKNIDSYLFNEELDNDLNFLKEKIEDINQEKFKVVFGSDIDGFEPIGFFDQLYPTKAILYLNFEKNEIRNKVIKNSDYYLYLSLCHKSLEN
jgi:hypothetical protein